MSHLRYYELCRLRMKTWSDFMGGDIAWRTLACLKARGLFYRECDRICVWVSGI